MATAFSLILLPKSFLYCKSSPDRRRIRYGRFEKALAKKFCAEEDGAGNNTNVSLKMSFPSDQLYRKISNTT